ncbi:hypothetical protein C8D88_11226 [Lentzea atacamensis]|uniref:Uncharacterized protein n=1 Tax=Lentzea atacamensis TaxID=531938 RepID=A0A316HNG6_9PSEU|nr:hypothetical protein C8D88_11226 [Lentzea atacamensis]
MTKRGVITAVAVPSAISHSTPGERSTIGVPARERASAIRSRTTGARPKSGRGANSTTADTLPSPVRTKPADRWSVTCRPVQRVCTVIVTGTYRWPNGSWSFWGLMEKWPDPPSSAANNAGESGAGWHSHVTSASDVTRASARRSESGLCRSIGTATRTGSSVRKSVTTAHAGT